MNPAPITLLVMTDGRPTVHQAIASFEAMVEGDVRRKVIHDDSGRPAVRQRLATKYGPLGYDVIGTGPRRGFGGAIDFAWKHMLADIEYSSFVFHLEDDFTFNRRLNLDDMAHVLQRYPHITQMALRRQTWSAEPGEDVCDQYGFSSFIQAELTEWDPTEQPGVLGIEFEAEWLEHRRYWTTNPSLYRATLMGRGWPTHRESEGHFGIRLFEEDPRNVSAYWGSWYDGRRWVEHIGHTRVGTGY